MKIRFLHAVIGATGFALILLFIAALQTSVAAAQDASLPKLPNDYRFWYHVGSKSISASAATAIGLPADVFGDTFDAVFANEVALNDLRNGAKTFRDGAEFAAPFFKLSNPVAGLDQPGNLAFVAVMEKDSTEYASTGGWGFSVVGAAQKEITALESSCFSCHQSKAAGTDFVFSKLNDRQVLAVPASNNGVFLPPDYQNKLYWRSASVIRPEAATALGLPADIFGNTTDSIYMNNAALNALGSETRPFPVGSLFVADFHKAAFPVDGLGAEGDLAFTAVMLKGDPGTGDDKSTGDWRFEAFGPDGKPLTQLRSACISCHATKASNDFVFSGS